MKIDVPLNDAQEPIALPANEEVTLRIVNVTSDIDRNGHPYFRVVFEVPSVPNAKEFSKFYGLPHEDMTPKQKNGALWRIKELLIAIGADPSQPFETEDLIGEEADAILGLESSAEFGEQNYVKRFVTGA